MLKRKSAVCLKNNRVMRIAASYSHLNGLEYLLVHQPDLWEEIESTIESIDAEEQRTKISRERRMVGRRLFSPRDLNDEFKSEFKGRGWTESRTSYWVTQDTQLIRRTIQLPATEQKRLIEEAGGKPIFSYNQTDFVKDRVAIEVQFGKYAFVAFDLFVKHMAFFVSDMIDVGVEIVPTKKMHDEMSSGVPHYEGELYNLIREGRGIPAVPLILIGVEP